MEFVPYNKDQSDAREISLGDVTRSALMDIYKQHNPAASEDELNRIRDDIESFIAEIKQWFEKTMLPIKAAHKLAEKQYVSLEFLDEKLADEIIGTDNIDALLEEKTALHKRVDTIVDELIANIYLKPYEALFNQAIVAYRCNSYDLAVLGFFAIIDGLLSDITKDYGSVKIKQRIEKVANVSNVHISENKTNAGTLIQKASLLLVTDLLSESKPFNGEEPATLNRHWAMHGRTRTRKTKVDCEKLILFIYSLLKVAKNP